jgi:hypothetical protein|tara:strand:+ start:335 stop:589 length:255 start_codon:yes stop_codon:yes gene_type:complete
MKYKVIKNGFFVIDNLSNNGLLNEEEFEGSIIRMLIIGDIWEFDEVVEGQTILKCIKSKIWDGESSEGWFSFSNEIKEEYFELI